MNLICARLFYLLLARRCIQYGRKLARTLHPRVPTLGKKMLDQNFFSHKPTKYNSLQLIVNRYPCHTYIYIYISIDIRKNWIEYPPDSAGNSKIPLLPIMAVVIGTHCAGWSDRFDMVSSPYKYLMNPEPLELTRVTRD